MKHINSTQTILLLIVSLATSYLLLATCRYWLADFYYAKGDLGNAKKAVQLNSLEPNYRKVLGRLYTDEAITAHELGNEILAYEYLALADEELELSKKFAPRNVAILKSITNTYSDMKMVDQRYFQKEIEILENLTRFAPTDPYSWYNMALAYTEIGEKDKARSLLKNALDLKPDYEKAQTLLKYLQ